MGARAAGVTVHPLAVVDDSAVIGENTTIWSHACVLAHARIGRDCRVGHGAFIDRGVTIGDRAWIHNHACIYRPVALDDDVFIGPHVVFVNDPDPRSDTTRSLDGLSWRVRHGATVGASVTVMSDVSLAEYCFIGAGSVVTRDTVPYGLYVGAPARLRGFRCPCGARYPADAGLPEKCEQCQRLF